MNPDLRVEVRPGPGLVCRAGDVVAWIGDDVPGALAPLLLDLALGLGDTPRPGTLLLQRLGELLAGGTGAPGSFAVVAQSADGLTTIARGAAGVATGPTMVVTDPQVPGASDGEVPFDRPVVAGSTTIVSFGTASTGRGPMLDLRDGVVPGGGFVIRPAPVDRGGSIGQRRGGIGDVGSPEAAEPAGNGADPAAAPDPLLLSRSVPVDLGGEPPVEAAPAPAGEPEPAVEPEVEPEPEPGVEVEPEPEPATAWVELTDQAAAAATPPVEAAPEVPEAEVEAAAPEPSPGALAEPVGPEDAAQPEPTVAREPVVSPVQQAVLIDISVPPDRSWPPLPIASTPAVAAPASPDAAPIVVPPDTPQPEPGEVGPPMVDGVLCARQHFNHPAALYCATCGLAMVHQTKVLVRGPRPSLGVLILDDGRTFSLDRSYVLGRAPQSADEVVGGLARPLMIEDETGLISRAHVRVGLRDWDVILTDLNSANGTYVWNPGDAQWAKLPPGVDFTLMTGGRLILGRRTVVFESTLRR